MCDREIKAAEMIAKRMVSAWEFKHGPIADKARVCLEAIIVGAVLCDQEVFAQLVEVEEMGEKVDDIPLLSNQCYCEHDFGISGDIYDTGD